MVSGYTSDRRAALRAELDGLLSESVPAAVEREQRAFDDVTLARAPIVLFGAGGLGRQTLAGLRRVGIEPAAFVDNNPARWGQTVDGLVTLSAEEASARHATTATFVVTIWRAGGDHRYADFRRQLHALGCTHVVPFLLLFWKYSDALLPHYCQDLPHRVLEQRAAVSAAFDLWNDDDSANEYVAQVRWRLRADFDGLPHPVSHPQYFPPDLFPYDPAGEFVDCGAFDGDTLRSMRSLPYVQFGSVLALEPDPINFRKLESYVATLPSDAPPLIELLPIAAGDRAGTIEVQPTGTAASVSGAGAGPGSVQVECLPLDDVLAGRHPTYVKMDIEGAEPLALAGTRRTIQTQAPILALCVYHVQDHLWKLPLEMHALSSEYRFTLRPHNEEGWDLICYAVPSALQREVEH